MNSEEEYLDQEVEKQNSFRKGGGGGISMKLSSNLASSRNESGQVSQMMSQMTIMPNY